MFAYKQILMIDHKIIIVYFENKLFLLGWQRGERWPNPAPIVSDIEAYTRLKDNQDLLPSISTAICCYVQRW